MNNRVDYLSDRLVNLRGKHKSVNEVIPPDSIANGVSVTAPQPDAKKAPAMSQASLAQERRLQQTMQLYSDFEQRLVRRTRQAELHLAELEQKIADLKKLQQDLAGYSQRLQSEKFSDAEELTPSQLGERYRTLDRTRLEFFQTDAELEMLMKSNQPAAAAANENLPQTESFSLMYKRGLAAALTVGFTVAAAIIIAALMLCNAWG